MFDKIRVHLILWVRDLILQIDLEVGLRKLLVHLLQRPLLEIINNVHSDFCVERLARVEEEILQ